MMQKNIWKKLETAMPLTSKDIPQIWQSIPADQHNSITISFEYENIIYLANLITITQYDTSFLINCQDIKIWQLQKASN